METLVKFCKPEYNILNGCHTIRFGTLEYYRDLDPSFAIADENEGKETTGVGSFLTDTASREAVDAVQAVFPFPLGEGVSLQNCELRMTFPNCFIWCCSRAVKPISIEQGTQFDLEYTSFYEINDVGRFCRRLGELLINSLSSSEFANKAKNFLQGLPASEQKVNPNIVHHDVIYVEEKRSVIDEGQIHSYTENNLLPINPLFRPLFVKPKKYEKDHEYRFVCVFSHERYGILEARKDPVDRRIDPVSRTLIDQTLASNYV